MQIRHIASIFLVTLPMAAGKAESAAGQWPQFRGANSAGVAAPNAKPPVKIGPGENVLWKTEVPWAPSSPCVWEKQLFLTTYVDGELQTRCYAVDTGALVWSKGVKAGKLETFHRTDGSPAASTPSVDGRKVVSYFGSFGLVCYDLKGGELWRHPLPVAASAGGFGSGTSPIIAGNIVVLNRDQARNSSVLAISLDTGKTVWETGRPDVNGSFGTPIIWKNDGVDEVVTPGSLRLKGYELATGRERWKLEGVSHFLCTTPVLGNGLLFVAGWSPGKSDAPWPSWEAFLGRSDKNKDNAVALEEFDPSDCDFARGMDVNQDGTITKSDFDQVLAQTAKGENVLVAVKPGGRGTISETHVAWKFNRGLPYVSSPLYYDGRIYLVKDGGMMSSFEAATGHPFYVQERLGTIGSYYASPVAADGRIYLASLPGKLTVVKAGGDRPEILHQAEFGERIFATPALVRERLYLRTATHLWAFGS